MSALKAQFRYSVNIRRLFRVEEQVINLASVLAG